MTVQQLPSLFTAKMKRLLGKDADAFFASFHKSKVSGIRVNTLKISVEAFQNRAPFPVQRVPHCPEGFIVSSEDSTGKHPFHAAGLYYVQEPSAMFPAQVLAARPGEKILDLCAAPGGKTTQIAAMMKNRGLLVANEIHPRRVKALTENIERMGIANTVVTNESPQKLAEHFRGFFDRILVDAPCSGEGMFRKDPQAACHWSPEMVKANGERQRKLLENAAALLKEGGTLVYSTCTFSPEENERVVESFLKDCPEMEIVPVVHRDGVEPGRPEWGETRCPELARTARLWPHRLAGEGHFTAKFVKKEAVSSPARPGLLSTVQSKKMSDLSSFYQQYLQKPLPEAVWQRKQHLFLPPSGCPSFGSLKVMRAGLYLGERKKNRFEPHHALAMAMTVEDAKYVVMLEVDDGKWNRYLRGETFATGGDRGWVLVGLEGFPLGWGKEVKGTLKNFYPKGLRR